MIKDIEYIKEKLTEMGERSECYVFVEQPKIPFCLIEPIGAATLEASGSEYFRLPKYKVSRFSRKEDEKANKAILKKFSDEGHYSTLEDITFDNANNVYITEFIII